MLRPSLVLLAAALVLAPASVRAGCLAPSDVAVDVSTGTAGPLWGNDSGAIVYSRRSASGKTSLALRRANGSVDEIALEGGANEFFVGNDHELWDTFHTATVNAAGDVAFVASTKIPDDPATPVNEATARRGAYARSGNQLYRVARFGEPSPVRDAFNVPVPWGSVFDAVAADADANGRLTVVFSGQLAGGLDQRFGLFRWSEASATTATPVLLTGQDAPSGGKFVSFGRLRGNASGDVVFFAVTRLTDSSPQVAGLFLLRADGSKARVVKFGTDGDAAPGGGTFSIAADFDMDQAGVVSFAATLQGGGQRTGLFRSRPPLYEPEALLAEGDASPLAGSFGSFARAIVRANPQGDLVLGAELSDDIGSDGIFTLPADGTEPQPLVLVDKVLSAAAVGAGRAAYTSIESVRIVVPSDGSEEGPTDFRVAKLDLRNSVPLRTDSLALDVRFRLAPWSVLPPASFRGDATRFTPSQSLTGAALTKIAEVKVFTSSGPGNNFVFGIAGTDAAPAGTVKFNGQTQEVKSLAVAADGTSATWKFAGNPGPGTFVVNLLTGTATLKVTAATLQPSYEAPNFRVGFVLRSAEDVAQSRADADSWFRREVRIDGQQPRFGQGRRVTSQGEKLAGGTVFVDTLRVTRRAAKGGKPASDSLQFAGTLRLCPGNTAPATPHLTATVRLGDFALTSVEMSRVGRTALYRYTSAGTSLTVDVTKGSFALVVKELPTLSALADAVAGSATNGPERTVGGMVLDFTLDIPRVYEASFPVAVVRLPKGVVFQR